MRIAGNLPHPRLKITLFSLDDRWTVQFEAGSVQQTFKYKKADYPRVETLKTLFPTPILERIERSLGEMKRLQLEQGKPTAADASDDFPTII